MRRWRWRILSLILLACVAATAGAQVLEGVLMPGKVIAGHAKVEAQCEKCHVKFDKDAQDRLCLDCHKEVARDLRDRHGLHGRRVAKETCRSCHTDHKGRDVNVAPLAEKGFDHATTGFTLAGAHRKVECRNCHAEGKKRRAAPATCDGCHRKDDKHKGTLGPKCLDCHTETTWKEARFDHATTKFALTGKHVDAKCKTCHADNVYKGAPTTCVGCHRKDDKQHRGRLGDKCEACHTAANWKDVSLFSHERDGHFALRGKHHGARCETCHKSPTGLVKTPKTCIGCHEADDKHKANLGTACGDCHTEQSWKEAKYNHELSVFRLRGKHRDVKCKECHRDLQSYRKAPQDCLSCHRKDDTHKTRYGDKCESCHTEKSWRDIVFRHDRDTKYALTGKHVPVKCDSCHVGHAYRDKLTADCYACHRKDDKHLDQLGRRCDECHDTVDWKKTARFDHRTSRFPLVGRHIATECKLCHLTPAFKDAKLECIACHVKEDTHKRRLGTDCAACHNARDWKLWDYDHARRARYALDGAHARAACVACHRLAGDKLPAVANTCASCHVKDDVHGGSFGAQCERCHTTRNFRDIRPFGFKSMAPSPSDGVTPTSGTRQ